MPPAPVTLTVVWSLWCVTCAAFVPLLVVFLGLSVLDLGSMYVTDRRQMRIIAGGIITVLIQLTIFIAICTFCKVSLKEIYNSWMCTE